MNRIASVILLFSGCVCLARPADSEPVPDGVDREALKKLTRQLGPPVVGTAITEDSIKRMLEQYTKDPKFQREIEQFMRENPDIVEKAKANSNFKLDPAQKDQLEQIARKANIKPPSTQTPVTPPIESPRPTNQSERPPDTKEAPPGSKGGEKRGRPDGMRQQPPQLPGSHQDPQTEEFRKAAQMWEQFVGPLNKTPAVQKVMQQVFTNMNKDKNGNLPPWMRGGRGGSMSSVSARPSWFMRQLNGLGKSSTWDFTGFRAPDLSYGSSHNPSPSMSMESSMFEGISLDNPKSMLTLLGIIVAVVVLMAVLKRVVPGLRDRSTDTPQPLHGLGPWPIDPRTIADRAGLVVAFEYLSVLLCGDGARVWNHVTIAEALRDQVPQSAGIAEPLARYYALARYSPNTEQFTPEMIAEARGYLCQLAGV